MSSCRRSGRARKKVDYGNLVIENSPDGNSDDDFQVSPSGPPPTKKVKTSTNSKKNDQKEEKQQKPKASFQLTKRKERLSLGEKLYQRELEAAIEASMNDSQSGEDAKDVVEPSDDGSESDGKEEQSTHTKQTNKMKLKQIKLDKEDEKESDNNKENDNLPENLIESPCSKDYKESVGRKTKEPASTMMLKEESDGENIAEENSNSASAVSDFDMDDDGESFCDADDDSDFDAEMEEKRKKKKEKKVKVTPAVSPTKLGVKPRTSVITVTPLKMLKGRQQTKSKNLSAACSIKSVSSVSSSASNSPSIYSGHTVLPLPANLNSSSILRRSPGSGLGGVNIKSSGMPLRLGLSRNVRVKPLHSNVSIQH